MIAYDSARPLLIPAGAQAVLPYADGHFHWSNREFPAAQYRYFTVLGNPDADIIDVEPGCIWPPARARDWAQRRLALHHPDLTVYCDRDTVAAVREAMAGLAWHLFLTTLDGSKPEVYDGLHVRAVQFTDRNNAYDESLIFDDGWLFKP
jgi:hypothetical protein